MRSYESRMSFRKFILKIRVFNQVIFHARSRLRNRIQIFFYRRCSTEAQFHNCKARYFRESINIHVSFIVLPTCLTNIVNTLPYFGITLLHSGYIMWLHMITMFWYWIFDMYKLSHFGVFRSFLRTFFLFVEIKTLGQHCILLDKK